jgi:NitT/TauT family transport system substrate-binding protein
MRIRSMQNIHSNAGRMLHRMGLFTLAYLLLLPGGCKDKPTAGGQDRLLTLTLDWQPEPEFGGFYQAKLGGIFRQHGVDIDLKNAGGGAPTWQMVAHDQTDFATTSADQVLIARSKGADVVAIFAVYQTSPQGIMAHSTRGFNSIKDVFTNPGALAAENNAWLTFLLNKFKDQVVVKVVPDPQGISNFLARQDYSQQCFVTSEPIHAEQEGSDPRTFLIADEGFNPYVTVVVTNGKILREKPDLAGKVVAACRDGWRAYLDNPSTANKEMGSINKTMDARTFTEAAAAQKRLIESDDTRKNGLGTMTLERWQTLREQLIDLGKTDKDKAPRAEDCFFNPK